MEKYFINGVEVEYDTFDMDAMQARIDELRTLDAVDKEVVEGEDVFVRLRRLCEARLDFFDAVLGEGMAEKIFGHRVNAQAIMRGFEEFNRDVNGHIAELPAVTKGIRPVPPAPVNRAQRRAASHG